MCENVVLFIPLKVRIARGQHFVRSDPILSWTSLEFLQRPVAKFRPAVNLF